METATSTQIPVKYIDTIDYRVLIHQDDFPEGPDTWGNFTIVQFRDRDWSTYEELESSEYVTESGKLTPATRAKLRAGKMFTLDYRRYSSADGGYYRLDGGIPTGEVDSSDINGFIIFEDEYIKGTSYEERKKYAEQDLETYTQYCQGEVYWVKIVTASGREIDSLGGLYGDEGVKQFVAETIPDAVSIEYVGVYPDGTEYETSL